MTDSNVPISSSTFEDQKGVWPPSDMNIVVARHCFYERQVSILQMKALLVSGSKSIVVMNASQVENASLYAAYALAHNAIKLAHTDVSTVNKTHSPLRASISQFYCHRYWEHANVH